MDALTEFLRFVYEALLAEFIVVVAGVLTANTILAFWLKRRYGGWRIRVIKNGVVRVDREISPQRAKAMLHDWLERSQSLKSTSSPYGVIHCDLIDEGVKLGLLTQDNEARVWIIDLDKNPTGEETRF